MKKQNPTIHRMTRRAEAHDYARSGLYHVTLHVAEGMGQPLGRVVGDASAPDGSPDAPRTALSPVGRMVEHELLHAIRARYPMVRVDAYTVMPEHVHVLLDVTDRLLSYSGRAVHLGQVIAGFKKGCNRRYWELTGQPAANIGGQTGASSGGQTAAHTPAPVPGGFPAGGKVPSGGSSGRPPLFAPGYCDVMPVDAAQLATQRAYIAANPRSRLLRSADRERLQAQRGGIDTAVSLPALRGYLMRECAPSQSTPEALAGIACRLLTAGGTVACDSFGDRVLLQRPLLPVVCHRRDKARLQEHKRRCLEAAGRGAVLVSPRIAKGEQEIIDAAVRDGFPVVLIADNGFPVRYHPSQERLDQCAAGRLLLVTPWQYRYRPKSEAISVAECKTMNCVAQALCRTKDTWWKGGVPAPAPTLGGPATTPCGKTAGNTVPGGSPAGNPK